MRLAKCAITGLPQNQRFCGKRKHSEVSELSALAGSEGYGACADEAYQGCDTLPKPGVGTDLGRTANAKSKLKSKGMIH